MLDASQDGKTAQQSSKNLPETATTKDNETTSMKSEMTKVMNEEGKLLEVLFDPVLKCYYEPSKNVYYQIKDVIPQATKPW